MAGPRRPDGAFGQLEYLTPPLRLTADAYPEVMAQAQLRFGYVIPPPPGDQQ